MASSRTSSGFGVFLFLSSFLYVCEIALCARSAFMIYEHEDLRLWLFVPYGGLLLLPMVCLQLVSAVLLLMKQGDKLSTASSICVALLHILQLGFLWRHLSLMREVDPSTKARDIVDLNRLQMLHTFSSIIPLLLLQSYSMLNNDMNDWVWILTICVMLVGSCVRIASYRHVHGGKWCYSLLAFSARFAWRFGELSARITALVVFASVYYVWVFLILLLHAITMMVCLCTSLLGIFENERTTKTHRAAFGCLTAYLYTFCFVDFSPKSSLFRYVFYYVVMFFENVVLFIVWYQRSDLSKDNSIENTIVIITASLFLVGIFSMTLTLRCLNKLEAYDEEKEEICVTDECINCRLSLCSKHNIKLQRPFSAGWMSQYQEALNHGNYYKNLMQDTMLDTDWESTNDCLNSSGEHWQIRDTDLESLRAIEKKKRQYTSVQGTGTYTHKRFFDSDPNISKHCGDNDSISSRSGLYDEDWRLKSDTVLSQLSAQDTLSMLSSRTKLLTDSWDCLIQENDDKKGNSLKHPKQIDILNSLIRKDLDTSFFSDGYTTDHTLDSYQLPVTVLAKRKAFLNYRKSQPTYSVASDSTDCTICAFIKHNDSPASSRRTSYLDLSKDSCYEEIRHLRHGGGQVRMKGADLTPRKSKTKDYVQRRAKSGKHEAIYMKRDGKPPSTRRTRNRNSEDKPKTTKVLMPSTNAPMVNDVSMLYSVPLKPKKSSSVSSEPVRTRPRSHKADPDNCRLSAHIYQNHGFTRDTSRDRVSSKLSVSSYSSDSKVPRRMCVNMLNGTVLPTTVITSKRENDISSQHSSVHSKKPQKAEAKVSCASGSEKSHGHGHQYHHLKNARTKPNIESIPTEEELDKIMINLKTLSYSKQTRPSSKSECVKQTPKLSISTGSESSDSAYPRHTPLSSYLLVTDDDQDGTSESSCEMVI